jgi:hypothetical protein
MPAPVRGEVGTSGRDAFPVELSELVLLRSDDDETTWRAHAALVYFGRAPGAPTSSTGMHRTSA